MRWLRFNIVGIMGFVLQTATLWLLIGWAGLTTSVAVAIAVLAAVSHNFMWHEYVTWPDRSKESRLTRWLFFNISTGAVSVTTSVGLTMLVTSWTGLPVLAANGVAVAVASTMNFLVNDRLVFRR